MAHKPSRATDALVHRALTGREVYSDDLGEYRARQAYHTDGGKAWLTVPAYTTDLMAWDGVGDDREWEWQSREWQTHIDVTLMMRGAEATCYNAVACYPDHNNNRFQAQAMARAEIILQMAERSKR